MAQFKAGEPSLQTDPPAELEQITHHDPSRGQTSPQRGQKHTRGDDPLTLQHNTKQPKTGRQEDGPPVNFLDRNTTSTQHPTLVNDRSGPYPTWTIKDTPRDILNRLCPWTKEIPPRLASRLLWEPSEHTPEGINGPTALILYAGADDSHSLKSAMLSISRLGPCPSWRLTTNDRTRSSVMICFLGNPMAPFVEEPCLATSEYLEGDPNRVHLSPSGTGHQPTHGVFLNSLTRISLTQTMTVFFCYDSW